MIVDVVLNHCSVAHPSFQAAVAAGPGSRERARFHFAPGRGRAGNEPPNNWPSVFGGPAWTRIAEADGTPGEWYLHLYAPGQPDWNWRDPRTTVFFDEVVRFWLDRGADGLRIDVAYGLFKAEALPDLDHPEGLEPMRLGANPLACDQDEVHDVYRRWRNIADSYERPRALIGEVNLAPDGAWRYTRPDELHQVFAYGFLTAPWDAPTWQAVGTALLAQAYRSRAPVTWVIENHDVVRSPNRYDGTRGPARARAALLAMLGLPGAAYLYQGQELGLPHVDLPAEARHDPAYTHTGISRDGCRVPLPWRRDHAGAHGFSPPDARPPWLPLPSGWGERSVEAQDDDWTSPLALCRAALDTRRRLHAEGVLAADDNVRWATDPDHRLVAHRGRQFILVIAMGDEPVPLPRGELLLASSPLAGDGRLPPDTAAWLLR